MRLDVNFPLLIKGTPANGRKADRLFYGSQTRQVETEEFGLSDMDTVLDPVRLENEVLGRVGLPRLLSREGRLFRPLGPGQSRFDIAHGETANPLAAPVFQRCRWLITMHGVDTARNYKLWPESGFAGMRPVDRNAATLANVDMQEVDASGLEDFNRMYDAMSRRLVTIDGTVWMETPPPCINVRASDAYMGDPRKVTLSLGFMPLGVEREQFTMRFPLTMADEAVEFATRLAAGFGNMGADNVAPLEFSGIADTNSLWFDQRAEEAQYMAVMFASNIVRRAEQHLFHKHHREAPPLFEDDYSVALFEKMKTELFANNDITGVRGELGPMLPEIFDLWMTKKLRKSTYYGLNSPPTFLLPFVMDRARDNTDDAPINLYIEHRPGPKAGP